MKRNLIPPAALALLLLLSAGLSHTAESTGPTAGATKTIGNADKTGKSAKPATAPAKVKLVDINSAGKADLKTLPGIGDAEANRIIAGRPYLSKAKLTTENILSRELYEGLKSRVIARQNRSAAAKLQEKQKGR